MEVCEAAAFSLDSDRWSKRSLKSSIGGFSQPAINQIRSLQGLLAIIQPLKLDRFQGSLLYQKKWIGEGTSYNVFQCQLPRSRKVVAQKQVKLPEADANIKIFRTQVSCVLKEIEVMHHPPLASHRNIISLFGYGWNGQGSIPFLICEWAPYGTMRKLLKDTQLSPREKQKLCRHVAVGLLELHLCGIAHGDVKLDNVLIVPAITGKEPDCVELSDDVHLIAKLADFGHSVLLNPVDVRNADVSQTYRGTIEYNAPEVGANGLLYSPDMQVDFRKCDVWSYGLLCLEALRDGAYYTRDEIVMSSIKQHSDSTDEISGFGQTSKSTQKALEESISMKGQIFEAAVDISRRIATPRCRTDFIQSFKQCLTFSHKDRLADLSRLLLLAHGVYEELPTVRLQLQEQIEEEQPWSFKVFRPLEAMKLVHVAKAQIVSDAEASMELAPSARTALHIALAYATGFGVAPDFALFVKWAKQSSSLGLSVADLTLDILQVTHANSHGDDGPRLDYTQRLVNEFKKRNQGAGFALLNQSLLPSHSRPATTAVLDKHLQDAPDFEGLHRANFNIQGTIKLMKKGVALKPLEMYDIPEESENSRTNTWTASDLDRDMLTARLHAASRAGDWGAAKNFLDQGADPSVPGSDGTFPLHWLFMFPASQQMTIALRLQGHPRRINNKRPRHIGPGINYFVPTSQKLDDQFPVELFGTPLNFAVATASLSAVRVLLSLGASATIEPEKDNLESSHGSPLRLAISLHLPTITKLLLQTLSTEGDILPTYLHPSGHFLNSLSETSAFERRCIHGDDAPAACRETIAVICTYLQTFNESSQLEAAIGPAIERADKEVATALLEVCQYDKNIPGTHGLRQNPMARKKLALASAVASFCTDIYDSATSLELIRIAIEEELIIEEFNKTRWVFDSRNPIFLAFESRRDDLLQCLKSYGIDICAEDPDGRTALHNMYIRGIRFFPVHSMIALGFDINAQDKTLRTPLCFAAEYGDVADVEELLANRASVDAIDNWVETPLHVAAIRRHHSIVECLLNAGSDPRRLDKNGLSALHYAAADREAVHIFSRLFNIGNPDPLTASDKMACLASAVSHRNEPLLRLLVEMDTSPLEWPAKHVDFLLQRLLRPLTTAPDQDEEGRTPLSLAAGAGLENVVGILCANNATSIASIRDYIPDKNGRNPLSWAVGNGYHGIAKLLAELRPFQYRDMLSRFDLNHRSPFSWAAGNGHLEAVEEILERVKEHPSLMRNLGAKCKAGRTPLSWAAGNGHHTVVKRLMDSALNPDINSKDFLSQTPLCWAASNGRLKVVEQLLTSDDCDINAKDESGRTPLSRAVSLKDEHFIKNLLNILGKSVDIWEPDYAGHSPMWWALDGALGSGNGVADLLLAHDPLTLEWNTADRVSTLNGDRHPDPLIGAASHGHKKVIDFLLTNGKFDAEAEARRGQIALRRAAQNGYAEIVRSLLNLGVSVNAADSKCCTPLLLAAERGHRQVVEVLLAHNDIDIEFADVYGRTPLYVAMKEGYRLIAVKINITKDAKERESQVELPAGVITSLQDQGETGETSPEDMSKVPKARFRFFVIGNSPKLKSQLFYCMTTKKTLNPGDLLPATFHSQMVSARIAHTLQSDDIYHAELSNTARGDKIYSHKGIERYKEIDVFILCFDFQANTRDTIEALRNEWATWIRSNQFSYASLLLVGVTWNATDANTAKSYMASKTPTAREKIAKYIGADAYRECNLTAVNEGESILLKAFMLAQEASARPKPVRKWSRLWWRRLFSGA